MPRFLIRVYSWKCILVFYLGLAYGDVVLYKKNFKVSDKTSVTEKTYEQQKIKRTHHGTKTNITDSIDCPVACSDVTIGLKCMEKPKQLGKPKYTLKNNKSFFLEDEREWIYDQLYSIARKKDNLTQDRTEVQRWRRNSVLLTEED